MNHCLNMRGGLTRSSRRRRRCTGRANRQGQSATRRSACVPDNADNAHDAHDDLLALHTHPFALLAEIAGAEQTSLPALAGGWAADERVNSPSPWGGL